MICSKALFSTSSSWHRRPTPDRPRRSRRQAPPQTTIELQSFHFFSSVFWVRVPYPTQKTFRICPRKLLVLSCSGDEKKVEASPCSTIFPSSMNTIRSPPPGEPHFVGDHHHGHSPPWPRLSSPRAPRDHFGIQRAGGLVEKHDPGLHGESAGDGHPLLLPAASGGADSFPPCPRCPPFPAATWSAPVLSAAFFPRTTFWARSMFSCTVNGERG